MTLKEAIAEIDAMQKHEDSECVHPYGFLNPGYEEHIGAGTALMKVLLILSKVDEARTI